MRTTVHIEDDLLRDLKEEAHRQGISLAKLMNRVLRRGMRALQQDSRPQQPYREKTFHMGEPKPNLDKALHWAATLEDDETCEKLARRK